VVKGKLIGEVAVVDGSPADTAGLKENDIILEVNGKKIDENNPLATMISQSKPGDKLDLKIWRDGKEKNISVKLEEMKL
jgi:S1-C subfamily serine protease